MNSAAGPSEVKNPKTGMSHRAKLCGSRGGCPTGTASRPRGAIQYVGAALKKVPDLRVTIEDIVAEDEYGIEPAAGILRNCDLADRQPADHGALGLPEESAPRARLSLKL
jgi:hypothetical protein